MGRDQGSGGVTVLCRNERNTFVSMKTFQNSVKVPIRWNFFCQDKREHYNLRQKEGGSARRGTTSLTYRGRKEKNGRRSNQFDAPPYLEQGTYNTANHLFSQDPFCDPTHLNIHIIH